MATMPIYGKNPLKNFSETSRYTCMVNPLQIFSKSSKPMTFRTLYSALGTPSPTDFVQMMILGWPWPTLRQGQLCFLMHLYWKMFKCYIFQKLLKSMNWKLVQIVDLVATWIHEYQRSRSLFDLCPRSPRCLPVLSNICSQAAGHNSHISCRALLIGGQNLFKWCRSHDQDERHTHKKFLLWNQMVILWWPSIFLQKGQTCLQKKA